MVTLSKRITRFIFAFEYSFTLLFLISIFSINLQAQESEQNSSYPKRVQVNFTDANTASDVLAEIEKVKRGAPATTIFVSSDSAEVIKNIPAIDHDNIVLLPYADVAKPRTQNRFVRLLKSIKDQTIQSVKSDRIGCVVVTFNLIAESVIWIHSGNLTTFQKSANITFTLLTALFFGLNKDRWAKTTAPIQNFIRRMTKLKQNELTRHDPRNLAMRFFSSFALASAISAARIPFLPMDSLVDFSLNVNSWTLPFLISFVSTIASFGWSEHIVLIDEKKQPITKFLFRRLSEIKSIALGTFAGTAMLFNPLDYGMSPWIVLGATGALGLTFYLNADQFSRVENNPILKRVLVRANKYKIDSQCLGYYTAE